MLFESEFPLYVIVPVTFPVSLPARAVSKVVLPLPEGPNIAVNSPGLATPVTPFSTFLVTFDSFPKTQPFLFWFVKVMLYETSSNYNIKKTKNKTIIYMHVMLIC